MNLNQNIFFDWYVIFADMVILLKCTAFGSVNIKNKKTSHRFHSQSEYLNEYMYRIPLLWITSLHRWVRIQIALEYFVKEKILISFFVTNCVNMLVSIGIEQFFIGFKNKFTLCTYMLTIHLAAIYYLGPQMFDFQFPSTRNGVEWQSFRYSFIITINRVIHIEFFFLFICIQIDWIGSLGTHSK